ncbi:MAG: hypothetical protein ABI142_03835 [Bryocella sp.]
MRGLKTLLVLSAAVLFLAAAPNKASAQVSFGINIGTAPMCPYGYFDYSPYRCAPYGYYGPEWFNGGVFMGAGPWFHARPGFRGYVNRRFDPRYGYRGRYPRPGQHYRQPRNNWRDFHGSHMYDEHGRVSQYNRQNDRNDRGRHDNRNDRDRHDNRNNQNRQNR